MSESRKTFYNSNNKKPKKLNDGKLRKISERIRRATRGGAIIFLLFFAFCIWQTVRHIQASYFVQGQFPTEVLGVPVHTVLIESGTEGRPNIKRQIRYIIIHETANTSVTATAEAHSRYLTSGTSGVTSWHYTVDDTEIYHHVPDDEVAWHAGDGGNFWGGNMRGIGIEMCVNEGGDFTVTRTNTAKLVAWLLFTYDLDIDAVLQHHDCSGKNCPMIMREEDLYDDFIAEVEYYLEVLKSEQPATAVA